MPGRPSTARPRQSTASRVSRKSSTQTLRSRPSTASRISSPNVVIPDEGPSSALRVHISSMFSDAQRTTASHRKLVINLRKVQEACCWEPVKAGKKGLVEAGTTESQFNAEVVRCVARLMGVKKAESVGDRIVRFLGLFLRFAGEKDNAIVGEEMGEEEEDVFPETPSSRLTAQILNFLLPLLTAKEKTTRYRATQLISHIINSLDSIDDELFRQLRLGLLKRVRDKESVIRVQAVLGLGRLAGNEAEGDQEDEDSDDESDGNLLEKLLDVLQNDPSADVRRSLLLNLPITPPTLAFLLERSRDQDPATRRVLYTRLLPSLGDFRHLSLSMREKLLRWGLRDRDENVRKAAGKLFQDRWIEDCAGTQASQGSGTVAEVRPVTIDAVLELLERIDVVNSGIDGGVALEAMKGFWEGRADYREAVNFDEYWENLTAESAFLARSFNEYVRRDADGKFESLVEEKMPEVTRLGFYLQKYLNQLIETLRQPEEDQEEDVVVEQEFIVEQLLQIVSTLDYSDEIGRRKMFSVLRETLAVAELPDGVTRLVVEGLRGVCGNDMAGERDFCGVVLEAVAEVHDTINPDNDDGNESFHSARSALSDDTPTKSKASRSRARDSDASQLTTDSNTAEDDEEKAIKEIMVNMKCLHIAQCLLENVQGNLQQNSHLATMLNNLVVPAVRSHEAPVRESGLTCLGLCCLLDKKLAEENLTLFLHCFTKGHDTLQISALQIIADILTTHSRSLLSSPTCPVEEKAIYKMFTKALKSDDKIELQAASCEALSKLMLGHVVKDEELLKALVVAYFDPGTMENLRLRQGLSYFLPVYCHSHPENQERMARVAVSAIHACILIRDNLDEEEEMVSPALIVSHLVEWTDPRKVVGGPTGLDEGAQKVNENMHVDLAKDVLEKINGNCSKEEKKVFCGMLGKLYISPKADSSKLATLYDLVSQIIEDKLVSDAPSRNALNKLEVFLGKITSSSASDETQLDSRPVSSGNDGETIFEEPEAEEAEEEEGVTVMVQDIQGESTFLQGVDEVLEEVDDEDEDMEDDL